MAQMKMFLDSSSSACKKKDIFHNLPGVMLKMKSFRFHFPDRRQVHYYEFPQRLKLHIHILIHISLLCYT